MSGNQDILERIRKLLGIDAAPDVAQIEKVDSAAAAAGVATKEVDPLAVLTELQTQVTALTAAIEKINTSLTGFAQKEMVDQAIAQGKRADEVLAQVKALFVSQGAGTGKKEAPVTPEQQAIIDKEKTTLDLGAQNPWASKYDYAPAGGH